MNDYNSIVLGDYIETLTDYHANGSYKTLKENIELKRVPDYAIMIRTLNFERPDFSNDLIYLNKKEYNYLKKSKVFPNDILMNKIANAGSIYLMPDLKKPVSLAMNLFLIRFNSNLNQQFMFYLMKTYESYIKQFANGTTTLTITKNAVKSLRFKIPPKKNQDSIAKILVDIDKKIELNNKINTELEAMAKLIYDYWFVQFDFSDANGKPYQSSGGKMVYNDALKRKIPEGWGVIYLGEYVSVKKGELITKKTAKDGKIKVVAAGLNFSYFHSTANYEKNTITISGSGASAGFINFWREPIFASDCITVRGSTDSITLLVLHYLKLVQEYIFKQARGSAQPHVYPNDISNLKYIIPPQELIDKFGKLILNSNEKIANNLCENERLVALRDWLLPMLMNGQVTVR